MRFLLNFSVKSEPFGLSIFIMPLWKLIHELEKKRKVEPKFHEIYVKFTSVSIEFFIPDSMTLLQKQKQKLLVYYNRLMRFWKLIHIR